MQPEENLYIIKSKIKYKNKHMYINILFCLSIKHSSSLMKSFLNAWIS